MRAVKDNKVYTVSTDQEKQFYMNNGYDIIGDDGKVVEYGVGKTVPYKDFAALKEKCSALETENEKLKKDNSALKKENEKLKKDDDGTEKPSK